MQGYERKEGRRACAHHVYLLPLTLLLTGCVFAEPDTAPLRCERMIFRGVPYNVVHVNLAQATLRLYWKRTDGQRLGNFTRLAQWLASQGQELRFATNAGIYGKDFKPLGLHVEEGETLRRLNRAGPSWGNFTLKPNGVFYVDAEGAHILETDKYAERDPAPRLATQSGPLLIETGRIHPSFRPESDSRYVRNAVGVVSPEHVVFVLSLFPVNFHDFASFFMQELHCADALYLDGAISGMYAPCLERRDSGLDYVGMLAVTEKAEP